MTTNLDTLRKTAEAATPGPWEAKPYKYGLLEDGRVRVTSPSDSGFYNLAEGVLQTDASHIATFDPPTVLALLSRLEQAEQAVQRVREVAESSDDKHLTMAILEALDGETRRLADDALGGDQDG